MTIIVLVVAGGKLRVSDWGAEDESLSAISVDSVKSGVAFC